MDYNAMKDLLEFYIDDVIDTPIAVTLFNEGKNKMANVVNANFPDLPEAPVEGDQFVFDAKYHNAPVLYAAAMYKGYDSSIGEKQSYMADFQEALRDFQNDYIVPLVYRNDSLIYKYTVTETTGIDTITVTDESFNRYGNLSVYVNNLPASYSRYGNVFTFATTIPLGSTVIVAWEPNQYYVEPWNRMW
jgi:hypothetical protein